MILIYELQSRLFKGFLYMIYIYRQFISFFCNLQVCQEKFQEKI